MNRVMVYIDGFNLYFGMRSKGWRKYYWLDLLALSKSLLKPEQSLEGIHYFTSRIRSNGHNLPDMQRQTTYVEALGTLRGLQCHFGHFLEKTKSCRSCGAVWTDYEEKMTDVNIAVQLLADSFNDRFDTALLLSGDSDLTAPINQVRAHFPSKRIIVVFPPGRHSVELNKAANAAFVLGEARLRQAQFPPSVTRKDGFVLHRPVHWN